MSPRLKMLRKVMNPPVIKGYKPYGPDLGSQKKVSVNILYEEYEAIRLCDYDNLNHFQASVMMNVSRPTFTRIYASALQKIAMAFVEGRQISIEGGKVYFDSDWYSCSNCKCNFNNPERDKIIKCCPLCGSDNIERYSEETDITNKSDCEDVCVCPVCGYEIKHHHGTPCNKEICPECNSYMKRKRTPGCNNIKTRKK